MVGRYVNYNGIPLQRHEGATRRRARPRQPQRRITRAGTYFHYALRARRKRQQENKLGGSGVERAEALLGR